MARNDIKAVLNARDAELVPVQFIQRYKVYNIGESAGFVKTLADQLVAARVAVYYEPPKATKSVDKKVKGK